MGEKYTGGFPDFPLDRATKRRYGLDFDDIFSLSDTDMDDNRLSFKTLKSKEDADALSSMQHDEFIKSIRGKLLLPPHRWPKRHKTSKHQEVGDFHKFPRKVIVRKYNRSSVSSRAAPVRSQKKENVEKLDESFEKLNLSSPVNVCNIFFQSAAFTPIINTDKSAQPKFEDKHGYVLVKREEEGSTENVNEKKLPNTS